jgi:hypothetical protein
MDQSADLAQSIANGLKTEGGVDRPAASILLWTTALGMSAFDFCIAPARKNTSRRQCQNRSRKSSVTFKHFFAGWLATAAI